ncbi:MAG: hypothetical protein HYX51_05490 [Chloroflexi bacterium]|nr:hypothetical protein [Chloroflexota bacterium]
MALLVLIQATLAGRFLNYSASNLRTLHGIIGNVVFLLAIVLVVLVVAAGLTGRARSGLLGSTVGLLVLTFAQIGMGYAGRENAAPAAFHIPNGVLIFGLTMSVISLALRAQREAVEP